MRKGRRQELAPGTGAPGLPVALEGGPPRGSEVAVTPPSSDVIHVFIGTKAQYIKTAPLLRLMESRGVRYRLVDSGQHANLTVRLREELGIDPPDAMYGGRGDVESIPRAVLWAMKLAANLLRPRRDLRREFFEGRGGVCVVHGDTPTTLLSTLLGWRAGLRVAHLESGLRSRRLLHPFPEELVRIAVMRLADVLFAPHPEAGRNLREMAPRGTVVELPANTTLEALRYALGELKASGDGPAIVTTHRTENLARSSRLRRLVGYVTEIGRSEPVEFVAHGPTLNALRSTGLYRELEDAGVEVVPLLPHREFAARLARARFVITDGGSIQEECYYLGVPTLLWRKRTERPEGVGHNVVVSSYDDETVRGFLAAPEEHRRSTVEAGHEPSEAILGHLLHMLAES